VTGSGKRIQFSLIAEHEKVKNAGATTKKISKIGKVRNRGRRVFFFETPRF